MDKTVGFGAGVGLLALIFFMPLINTLLGAFSGWIVGLLFSETILTFMAVLGITGLKVWQIGAALGFIGGFFRSTVTRK